MTMPTTLPPLPEFLQKDLSTVPAAEVGGPYELIFSNIGATKNAAGRGPAQISQFGINGGMWSALKKKEGRHCMKLGPWATDPTRTFPHSPLARNQLPPHARSHTHMRPQTHSPTSHAHAHVCIRARPHTPARAHTYQAAWRTGCLTTPCSHSRGHCAGRRRC